jgi:hypothetical protein
MAGGIKSERCARSSRNRWATCSGISIFAIEISPQYVDVAVKRWQTATDRQASLDGDGRTFDEIVGKRLPKAA